MRGERMTKYMSQRARICSTKASTRTENLQCLAPCPSSHPYTVNPAPRRQHLRRNPPKLTESRFENISHKYCSSAACVSGRRLAAPDPPAPPPPSPLARRPPASVSPRGLALARDATLCPPVPPPALTSAPASPRPYASPPRPAEASPPPRPAAPALVSAACAHASELRRKFTTCYRLHHELHKRTHRRTPRTLFDGRRRLNLTFYTLNRKNRATHQALFHRRECRRRC